MQLSSQPWRIAGKLAILTAAAALILGYHSCAEDGGIYLAEIKHLLDPRLYPFGTEFVSGHLGSFPGFADAVAWLVRTTAWKLDWVMLGLHLACLCAVLLGTWSLAVRCYAEAEARWGAVGLVALCLGMPVAGTSLMLVDPYVTARSVAFALTVTALGAIAAFAADHSRWAFVWCISALGLAVLAHPLMGVYGAAEASLLGCLLCRRRAPGIAGVVAALLAAAAAAAALQALAPPESAAYRAVALTRYYWFLGKWHWYELLGVAAPLVMMGLAGWRRSGVTRALAWMGVAIGSIGLAIAGLFARESSTSYAVARLQPLRCFQVIYLLLLMTLGASLGKRVLRRSLWRWVVAGFTLAGAMTSVQRQTYPASAHLELPGARGGNRWEEAFVWIRENSPRDAKFALDEDYVHRPGEDAQGFRAVAERSALPDYSKDGGQASIRPELTEAWGVGQRAQTGLTGETDAERVVKLGPLGITWLVMGLEAETRFVCPYQNEVVKVCRLGR